jgi:uncharacterized repeat protein (TIGR03803 family)
VGQTPMGDFAMSLSPQRFAPMAALLFGIAATACAASAAVHTTAPPASSESVLYSFGGVDGAGPLNGIIADKTGAFYGTTAFGGIGAGTVFKLTPSGSGYTESVLYDFKGGNDGSVPEGIVARADGTLYGATFVGGGSGNGGVGWGTVFKLTPGASGYTETVLYRFRGGTDAWEPLGPLVFDKSGSLYGAAAFGGALNDGAVFKLTPTGSGYAESLVYALAGGAGGQLPEAGLTIDAHGSIYGTTMYGGNDAGYCDGGCGTVFKLTPGKSGYSGAVIYAFDGPNGNLPDGAVTVDRSGAVYGTTFWGGTTGVGVVFKLTPQGSSYAESVLHSFTGKADGFLPEGTLLLKSDGTLYGTAGIGGGGCRGIGCGSVFSLTPSHAGYAFHVVYDFRHPITGAEPEQTNLLSDAGGALYGSTRSGGSAKHCADGGPGGAVGCGVLFKIVP